MKKQSKVIFTSCVTMALSAALIAGSTFALFTSEGSTNIAINAGKVNVTATVSDLVTYSASWNDEKKAYDSVDNAGTVFVNGGEAVYEDGVLAIENITPGDGVRFNIQVENKSTVAIKYQTVLTALSATDKDGEADANLTLYKGLGIYVDGVQVNEDRITAVSEWTKVEKDGSIDPISVEVTLPITAGNEYQNLGCEIAVGVYAVQSNGHDETHQNSYIIRSADSLSQAVSEAQSGDTIAFADDITIDSDTSLEIPEDTDLTFDLAGNTLDIESSGESEQSGIVVGPGSSLEFTDTSSDGSGNVHITVSDDENGVYNDWYPIHAKGDAENRASVDIKDVSIVIDNDEYFSATIAADYADITLGEGAYVELNGNNCAKGFFVNNNSTMDIDGGEIYAKGKACPILVGGFGEEGEESVVNLKSGKITTEDSNDAQAAIEVYPYGIMNITGGTIEVKGDMTSTSPADEENRSDSATGISLIGGGEVNMTGGEMILNPTKKQANGFMIINNQKFEEGEVGEDGTYDLDIIYFLHAKVRIGGTAKITSTYVGGQAWAYIFASQRNGTQTDTWTCKDVNGERQYLSGKGTTGDANLVKPEDDDFYTVIIEGDAQITRNGNAMNARDGYFAYGSPLSSVNRIYYYCTDVIKDNRA